MAQHQICLLCLLILGALWTRPLPLRAAAPPDICETALRPAAARWAVPLDVMRAIALTETGQTGAYGPRASPWAVNAAGASHWFDSREAALAFVRGERAAGRYSFDVGCFQVNYRWHGDAFRSLDDMIDPKLNADYAARFLATLFAEFGDWRRAAGAYHSRTPALARIYRARFDRWRARVSSGEPQTDQLAGDTEPVPPPVPGISARGYTLLVSGEGRLSPASLVPDVAPLAALFAVQPRAGLFQDQGP